MIYLLRERWGTVDVRLERTFAGEPRRDESASGSKSELCTPTTTAPPFPDVVAADAPYLVELRLDQEVRCRLWRETTDKGYNTISEQYTSQQFL